MRGAVPVDDRVVEVTNEDPPDVMVVSIADSVGDDDGDSAVVAVVSVGDSVADADSDVAVVDGVFAVSAGGVTLVLLASAVLLGVSTGAGGVVVGTTTTPPPPSDEVSGEGVGDRAAVSLLDACRLARITRLVAARASSR